MNIYPAKCTGCELYVYESNKTPPCPRCFPGADRANDDESAYGSAYGSPFEYLFRVAGSDDGRIVHNIGTNSHAEAISIAADLKDEGYSVVIYERGQRPLPVG